MKVATDEIESFLSAHVRLPTGASFPDGEMFGDWRITAFLGKGGGGEVYRAEHATLGMVAALKVYVPRADGDAAREEAARARFVRETAFLAQNAHPAFPRFLGSGERDCRPWYAMELLESRELPHRDKDVASLLLRVADGVSHLHSLGFVHRDIKPGNILWRQTEPVLADFGLLKDASPEMDSSLSIVDGKAVAVGTPRYAAPEQLNGGEITPSVDVYALGMLANECFGGKPPKPWVRIIRRATAAIPSQRYPSVCVLARAISRRHLFRNLLVSGALCILLAGSALSVLFLCGGGAAAASDREHITSPTQATLSESFPSPLDALATSVMSNGMVYSTINLNSNNHEVVECIELKGPQVVTLRGPGSLVASVSGSSNVTIRVVNCEFNNTTMVPYPRNAIGYVLEEVDADLLFSKQYYPTNRVRGALITGPNFPTDPLGAKMLFRR